MTREAWSTALLTAAVLGLAALVIATDPTAGPVARAALAPGLRFDAVTRVTVRRGDRAIELELVDGAARVRGPAPGLADARAVRDLVSAVAAARADQVRRRTIAAPRAELEVLAGARYHLLLGEEVPASGQVWIGLGDGRAALAPAWVGRALDREPDSLRVAAIVPPGTAAVGVEVHGPGVDLVLAGARLHRLDGGGARVHLEPVARAELLAALADLRLVAFTPAPPAPTATASIRVLAGGPVHELTAVGPCPGRPEAVAVVTSIGAGCVATAALDQVWAAARRAAGTDAIARAPWPDGAIASIAVDGGATLRKLGGGWVVDDGDTRYDADPDQVAALLAALAAPATPRPRLAADDLGVGWTITDDTGAVTKWRVNAGAIARAGEPITLVLAPAAAGALPIGVELRARQLLRLDPSTVAAIAATGVAAGEVVRGAVLGEWRAADGGPATAAAAGLPSLLATLAVDRWAPLTQLGPVRRQLRVTIDHPPPIDLAIGARDRTGCWLAIDRIGAAHVSAATCAALLAPLR